MADYTNRTKIKKRLNQLQLYKVDLSNTEINKAIFTTLINRSTKGGEKTQPENTAISSSISSVSEESDSDSEESVSEVSDSSSVEPEMFSSMELGC